MSDPRLQHDCALMITQHCAELLINVLDEEQQAQASEGIYQICLARIQCYEQQVDRMQQRLRPLDN